MNVVHFRISQISIPLLESKCDNISYFLSVHIGPTFVEFPLQLVDKKFLKSQAVISFNYDSAGDYKFYLELLEKKPYSEQIELASIEIPIRICKRNRQSNGSLEMDIKDKSFLDNVVTDQNDDDNEYDDMSDNEYDSDEEDKSIKIFFEIHRSEDKKKRFEAPLEDMRDFRSALLLTSRQSFDSSCSFTDSTKKKRRGASKLTVSPQEDNKENETELENKQKQNQQAKEELEEEFQRITYGKEQENEEGEDHLTEDENNQESNQIQQNEIQEEQNPIEVVQIIEEEEEADEKNHDENKNEEEEKIETNELEDKNDSQVKVQNKEEELVDDDENYRPQRKSFLTESDSQNSDDNDDDEENENNNEQTVDDASQFNILSDDDEGIPPVEPKPDLDDQENEENEEKQPSIPLMLSSDSAQYAVYPPRKKSVDTMADNEMQLSDTETNEQVEQENHEEDDLQLSDNQEEPELTEQQQELESNEQQEEPQKEDQVQQQQNEQNQQNEISLPPLSVEPQQQPLFYPQLNDYQEDVEPPVQQQPPILKFSSLDMQNFQCIDNFSFYPSPEQIGTYYIPPPLLPISIHPPRYD